MQNNESAKNGSPKVPSIGIIGTGWVGNTYAKNFQSRGFNPICYSLEPQYSGNKQLIATCDIVIIAVPTPTNAAGADYSILRDVLKLIGKNKIAVIKSTILPGTTNILQDENPDIFIIHSPEFLSVVTADQDAAHPKRNIFGCPSDNEGFSKALEIVKQIFPSAPFTIDCSATEAEIIKYSHNIGGYIRVVFHNLLYDISDKLGGNWDNIKAAMAADPNNLTAYLNPVHKNGRGAGGPCFIKDFAAFTSFYGGFEDENGYDMLKSIEKKNIELLTESNKDLDVLNSVFMQNVKL